MIPDLSGYFARIGFEGPARVDIATLRAVHRAHVLSIPYENLDVYLLRPVDRDISHIFKKIVQGRRGGWCYEMNGLLGWALREIGFDVTPHVGGVFRAEQGDGVLGNHLVHTVALEGQTWVADVGIGDFIKEPALLAHGPLTQGSKTWRLEHLPDGSWRFHNVEGVMPPSFDFFFEPADQDLLDSTCLKLQSDPESMFRQNLLCQQMTETGLKALVGRTWTDTDKGKHRHLVESEEELHGIIVDELGITPPPLDDLWDKVVARHEELIGEVS